jgi:hypothetical protein
MVAELLPESIQSVEAAPFARRALYDEPSAPEIA